MVANTARRPAGAAWNLAIIQGIVVLRRYDAAVWDLVLRRFGSHGATHPG